MFISYTHVLIADQVENYLNQFCVPDFYSEEGPVYSEKDYKEGLKVALNFDRFFVRQMKGKESLRALNQIHASFWKALELDQSICEKIQGLFKLEQKQLYNESDAIMIQSSIKYKKIYLTIKKGQPLDVIIKAL